jgi:hypothetical protein
MKVATPNAQRSTFNVQLPLLASSVSSSFAGGDRRVRNEEDDEYENDG